MDSSSDSIDDQFVSLVLEALKSSGKEIPDTEKISEMVQDIITKSLPELSEVLLKELKKTSSAAIKERRKIQKGFEKRLAKRWKKPIELLEMFSIAAYEAGEEFNNEYREDASRNEDYVFAVLVKMHARACQIGLEILTLLKSGFADGAHARWRTLHEIVVI